MFLVISMCFLRGWSSAFLLYDVVGNLILRVNSLNEVQRNDFGGEGVAPSCHGLNAHHHNTQFNEKEFCACYRRVERTK